MVEIKEKRRKFYEWWADVQGYSTEGADFESLVAKWDKTLGELVDCLEFKSREEVFDFSLKWSADVAKDVHDMVSILKKYGIKNYGPEFLGIYGLFKKGLPLADIEKIAAAIVESKAGYLTALSVADALLETSRIGDSPLRFEIVDVALRHFLPPREKSESLYFLLLAAFDFTEEEWKFLMDVWKCDIKFILKIFGRLDFKEEKQLINAVSQKDLKVLEEIKITFNK